jgi:hypothetical protein
MVTGISSPGGYFPPPLVSKSKTSATQTPAQAPHAEIQAQPEDQPDAGVVRAPEGDEQSLTREFNLFDLATRQFSQILPRLELATVPVE